MFGISFSEILLIMVLVLLIFGPERLPLIATKLGSFVATCSRLKESWRNQLYQQSGFGQFDVFRQEMQQTIGELKQQLQPQTSSKLAHSVSEGEYLYREYVFLYQPELDFSRQPELFDE